MYRYDGDYRNLVSKLNSAYARCQSKKTVNLSSFDKMSSEKQKFIEELPYEEVRKIGEKIRSNVTDISYLTKDEKQLLKEIKEGKKIKYRQAVCCMTGKVDKEQIMQSYHQFLWDESVYRTVYLYKGLQEPVRVVCENRGGNFPIHDVRNLSHEKQKDLVKKVLAAESRRVFNIETDSVLRIQGYLTSDTEMTVVTSFYPYIPQPMGVRGILFKIFPGMRMQGSGVSPIDEDEVQKMSEELRAKSVAYWQRLLLPLGKSMTIPGECRRTRETDENVQRRTFLYKELEEEVVRDISAFCKKQRISVKSLFLLAWGELLGKYHDEKNPLMLVAESRDQMNLFPVKIVRDKPWAEELIDLENQLEELKNYGNCTVQDIETLAEISFPEYFRMVHHFMEFSELDDMGTGKSGIMAINGLNADDTDINLFIGYHLYDSNIGINYIAKTGINEFVLDNLHELLIDEVYRLLSVKDARFDKKSFIKVSDTDEEKLRKIKLAQIGLYLKESGLFEFVTIDEIMKLAGYCKLVTCLSNDIVVDERDKISSLFILGDGKIEESITAADGMVKTLRIIRKGSVFGVESLLPSGEAVTSYTVLSPQVRLVEIDKEILVEVFRRKPDGWIALLEKEMEQKSVLQRLWTME